MNPPPPPAEEVELAPSFAPKKKANPLNIEEVLARKRAADEAAAKVRETSWSLFSRLKSICPICRPLLSYTDDSSQPKFVPRKERERLALEKREREVAEAQKKEEAVRAERQSFLGSSNTNGNGNSGPAIPTGPRSAPRGPAVWRNQHQQPNKGVDLRPPPPPKPVAIVDGPASQTALIRQRYMGPEQNQSTFSATKKRKRTTDKKFNFEWNADDDTTQTQEADPLYQNRSEASFFGRGRLGGFAADEKMTQARKYAKELEERDPENGKQRAELFLEMERRRLKHDKHGIDEHWSEKDLKDMRERDWRIFKEDFNISAKGGSIPNPMRNWQESGLPKRLLDIVDAAGYAEPSAVQRAAIPIALQSRDLIGVAVTGSGKTAAFLLPLLVYISDLPALNEITKNDGPYAIILAPTRELAQQIELEAKKFATPLGFTCVSLVGGHAIEEQAYNMRDGAEIIIATPGRLVDCIERRMLVLSQCCYIIMDEADRMIDMGFEEPVNKILDALPVSNEKPDTEDAEDAAAMKEYKYRQTMMYTATMPAAVERIARKYLRRPAIVTIGNVGEAVETVEQRVEFCYGEDKRKKRLAEILGSRQFAPPIIVFVNIKRNCDAVARDIQRMGYSAVTLHGSKTQDQRESALASLRNGHTEVLVATDLAGRGIDVPDVSLVINFNMATNIESYTHRIGRTGRAGKSGVAITFLGAEDTDVLYDLRKMIQGSSISKLPEELRKHEAAQQPRNKGRDGKAVKQIEESNFGGKGAWS